MGLSKLDLFSTWPSEAETGTSDVIPGYWQQSGFGPISVIHMLLLGAYLFYTWPSFSLIVAFME